MFNIVKRRKKEVSNYVIPECLNCGNPLASADNYCSYCGQKNVEKLSFGNFIHQIISGFYSYDSRFWNTIIPLLFKPGIVSKNFIKGRRNRYVNPFQMYFNVSIVFFLILGIVHKSDLTNIVQNNTENKIELDSVLTGVRNEIEKNVNVDSIAKKNILSFEKGNHLSEILIDSLYNIESKRDSIEFLTFGEKIEDFYTYHNQNPTIVNSKNALNNLGYPITFWNTFEFEQVVKVKKKYNKIKSDNGKSFMKSGLSYLSLGLFVFLPLFTLFLNLLYYRKKMNYMEHLVFVFHTQTVFFLLLIISTFIGVFSDYESVGWFMLLFLVYLFLALRNFYEQGWFKTFVKFLLLNIIYSQIGGLAIFIIALITFVID